MAYCILIKKINVQLISKAELDKSCKTNILIKRDKSILSSTRKKSSNIEAYSSWCNRLSSFIETEVVKNQDRNKRANVIKFFIDVAYSCCELGNFNSAIAIVGKEIKKYRNKKFFIFH